MPVVQPGAKVLVSGVNGYIAIWVARNLLERGYSVRGTVRSAEKTAYLEGYFKDYGDKFEVVVVEDITKEGAFDEAVKGVDAIEHIASPFHMNATNPQDLIKPAVEGTVGMLKSAAKTGSVKRVVVTSSCAAVLHVSSEPKVFTEVDWNEQSPKEVEGKDSGVLPITIYRASKTLGERAAWEFYNNNKAQLNWDLVVINPPFVFGPVIHDVPSASALNASMKDLYNTIFVENSRTPEALATQGSCWVDVRDLAEAHTLALQKADAAGERIIVSAGPYVWQDWIDVASSLSPSPTPSHKIVKGVPGAGLKAVHIVNYNTAKEARILGIKYRSQAEMTRDALTDIERRGW